MALSFACRGGCGRLVGEGQKCFDCACEAVERWLAERDAPAQIEAKPKATGAWREAKPKGRAA